MLRIREKLIIKLLVLAMCTSLMPSTISFAEANDNAQEAVTNVVQTTGAAVSINQGDTTEPVLNSISVDKKTVTNGEKITVTVDASDDISGIKSITVFYDAPAGSATKSAVLSKNAEGKYSGTMTIGQNDAIGSWKVSFISLEDNASNSIYVNNSETRKFNILKDLSSGDFKVNGTIPDTTEPVFNSISIDKKTAAKGEKLTVTVDASDDMSGIKSIAVFYDAPAGNATKSAVLSKNSDGKYSGTMTIGQNDAIGAWKVGFIALEDNASNSIYVNNSETRKFNVLKDLSSGDFEVNGTIPDTTEPVFNSISIDKKTAAKGEKLTVTVDASDDISGIKSIAVFYDAPAGNATKSTVLSKNSDGKYSGTMTIGLNDAVGAWKVGFIALEDNASNSIYVNNSETRKFNILKDLSSGDFEVNSTILDPTVTPTPGGSTEEVSMPTSVRILGTERVGSILTAELLKEDSVLTTTTTSASVSYEWFRLDNHYSENGESIGKDKTYELGSSDLGKYIKLVAYYNDKKVDEDITSKIVKKSSGGGEGGSGSSSGGSSGSSSRSSSSSSSSNNTSSDNTTVSNTNSTVIKTAKVEKSEDGKIKLVNADGQAVAGWQQVDRKWYLADLTGIAQTGWQKTTNGTWYLLNNDGVMATGWQQVNGTWYLLKDNGAMATGWQQTNGKWYYLYSDGSMASNTVVDGYRVDASGTWV